MDIILYETIETRVFPIHSSHSNFKERK